MNKDIKTVVVKPDNYGNETKKYPTVYLLHGYSGSYSNWIIKVPSIQQWANEFQLIIVCPNGSKSSWYLDSPVDSSFKYETFVGIEVPQYIDEHYKTIADRKARAITGLSMGGYGGLFLGFRHAETFAACGSMSGALNVDELKTRFDIAKRIGDSILNKKYYENLSIVKVIEKYPKDSLQIIFDCGVDDFTLNMNRVVHQKMLQLKISHDYTERQGNHDWAYWGNAIKYQLFFFSEYFKKNGIAN